MSFAKPSIIIALSLVSNVALAASSADEVIAILGSEPVKVILRDEPIVRIERIELDRYRRSVFEVVTERNCRITVRRGRVVNGIPEGAKILSTNGCR